MNEQELKEQLREELRQDFEGLLDEVLRSVNTAQAGRVIADSEEAVRDAAAEFRRRLYQKAIDLRLQTEGSAFSPSAGRGRKKEVAEQGPPGGDVSDDQWTGRA